MQSDEENKSFISKLFYGAKSGVSTALGYAIDFVTSPVNLYFLMLYLATVFYGPYILYILPKNEVSYRRMQTGLALMAIPATRRFLFSVPKIVYNVATQPYLMGSRALTAAASAAVAFSVFKLPTTSDEKANLLARIMGSLGGARSNLIDHVVNIIMMVIDILGWVNVNISDKLMDPIRKIIGTLLANFFVPSSLMQFYNFIIAAIAGVDFSQSPENISSSIEKNINRLQMENYSPEEKLALDAQALTVAFSYVDDSYTLLGPVKRMTKSEHFKPWLGSVFGLWSKYKSGKPLGKFLPNAISKTADILVDTKTIEESTRGRFAAGANAAAQYWIDSGQELGPELNSFFGDIKPTADAALQSFYMPDGRVVSRKDVRVDQSGTLYYNNPTTNALESVANYAEPGAEILYGSGYTPDFDIDLTKVATTTTLPFRQLNISTQQQRSDKKSYDVYSEAFKRTTGYEFEDMKKNLDNLTGVQKSGEVGTEIVTPQKRSLDDVGATVVVQNADGVTIETVADDPTEPPSKKSSGWGSWFVPGAEASTPAFRNSSMNVPQYELASYPPDISFKGFPKNNTTAYTPKQNKRTSEPVPGDSLKNAKVEEPKYPESGPYIPLTSDVSMSDKGPVFGAYKVRGFNPLLPTLRRETLNAAGDKIVAFNAPATNYEIAKELTKTPDDIRADVARLYGNVPDSLVNDKAVNERFNGLVDGAIKQNEANKKAIFAQLAKNGVDGEIINDIKAAIEEGTSVTRVAEDLSNGLVDENSTQAINASKPIITTEDYIRSKYRKIENTFIGPGLPQPGPDANLGASTNSESYFDQLINFLADTRKAASEWFSQTLDGYPSIKEFLDNHGTKLAYILGMVVTAIIAYYLIKWYANRKLGKQKQTNQNVLENFAKFYESFGLISDYIETQYMLIYQDQEQRYMEDNILKSDRILERFRKMESDEYNNKIIEMFSNLKTKNNTADYVITYFMTIMDISAETNKKIETITLLGDESTIDRVSDIRGKLIVFYECFAMLKEKLDGKSST